MALVLVGMFHYSQYADNAEPVGWALRKSGHGIIAAVVQAISVIGMFTALIGMMLAGSRLFLVGMFHYSQYADNAEPVGWALQKWPWNYSGSGSSDFSYRYVHCFNRYDVRSRLLYSFGRDGLLPSWLSQLNHKHLPNRALLILTIIGVVIGSMFPFNF